LQVIEGICLAQRINIAPRQLNAITPGQRKHQFRLKGTFKVQMQLRFR